jgi:hypothetical protein
MVGNWGIVQCDEICAFLKNLPTSYVFYLNGELSKLFSSLNELFKSQTRRP